MRPQLLRHSFAQLRIKITLPYIILAILLAFSTTFLVTRLLANLLESRFQASLLDAGQKINETIVRIEQEQLAVWRTVAYTNGFAEAVAGGDRETIVALSMPHLVNARYDSLIVLDHTGTPLAAAQHTGSDNILDYITSAPEDCAQWNVVQLVLHSRADAIGDKYAAVVETQQGWIFYTAGPIKQEGRIVGMLLMGNYLERLVQRLDRSALTRVALYLEPGTPRFNTLSATDEGALALSQEDYHQYLAGQHEWIYRQDITVEGREYALVFSPFKVRYDRDIGVLAAALPLSFVTSALPPAQQSLLGIFSVTTIVVMFVGTLVASAVVRRVSRLSAATEQVSQGDLTTQVDISGGDEIATLGQTFNQMVLQIREGQLYRDLLGLTASPAIARKLQEVRATGALGLEGQTVIASILFADIRGFSALSEGHTPAYIIQMLNTYLEGTVAIIQNNNGVLNKFIGDAVLAFFGVLPKAESPAVSAQHAFNSALQVLEHLKQMNIQRVAQGESPIRLGIGINTGPVIAGLLGSQSRFEYTVLGDTVNIAQRLSGLNKQYTEYDLFVSDETYELLQQVAPDSVNAVELGEVQINGRVQTIRVHALK